MPSGKNISGDSSLEDRGPKEEVQMKDFLLDDASRLAGATRGAGAKDARAAKEGPRFSRAAREVNAAVMVKAVASFEGRGAALLAAGRAADTPARPDGSWRRPTRPAASPRPRPAAARTRDREDSIYSCVTEFEF